MIRDTFETVSRLISKRCTTNLSPDEVRLLREHEEGAPLVLPGGHVVLMSRPQVNFRPERLVLDDDGARSFGVYDIKVGKNSQSVAVGGIPGSACSATSVGTRLRCDAVQIGMDVSVALVNVTAQRQPVPRAVFYGLATS